MDDDAQLVEELVIDGHICLDLDLPEAGRFADIESQSDVIERIVFGPIAQAGHPVRIPHGGLDRYKLPKDKFAIVTQEDGEGEDKRYTLRCYKEERAGKLQLRRKDGRTEVFLIKEDGTDSELLQGVIKTYHPKDGAECSLGGRLATGLGRVATGLRMGNNFVGLVNGIWRFVENFDVVA